MLALQLQRRCPKLNMARKCKVGKRWWHGLHLDAVSESLSKTSSMVGRSAGSVMNNSFELSLWSAAGIGLGLDGNVPVRQHSSIRVTNAFGNSALHKIGIIRESPATGNHAS
jgi:hypothetical protein